MRLLLPFVKQDQPVLFYKWCRNRRAAHEGLSKAAIRDYHPVLRMESILLASALLEDPSALERHFQGIAASATLSIMYDYPTLKTEDDENLKGSRILINRMSAASAPGAYLVEAMPWMLYIPETCVPLKDFSSLGLMALR